MGHGAFSGNPKTEWLTEAGGDRNMRMLEDFWYIDPAGRQWLAKRGAVVNGASIPETLWSSVGSPYTGEYRRASIVHDVACDSPDVDRDEADDMFFTACRAGGCNFAQAKLLYLGVRLGTWSAGVGWFSADKLGAPKPRLASEHTRPELLLRAKYTLVADKLEATPDDFQAVKAVVDAELAR